MANTTSASLKLTVQATGENSGTWGQITNTNLLILEQAYWWICRGWIKCKRLVLL
jgi:hypothetical protein